MGEQAIAWGAEALREQLVPLLPGLSVEVVARTPSTNTALLERARLAPERRGERLDADGAAGVQVRYSVESAAFGRRAVDLQPCLLVAEHQTGGRGRQGRAWQAAPGASLTFSLGLPLAAADWSGLSLAVGVALCEALEPRAAGAQPRLGLKWPNDLWLIDPAAAGDGGQAIGRKLGGILIETVAVGTQRLVVIGVGLNVRAFEATEATTGFAALQELDRGARAPAALHTVALPLVRALREFEQAGFAAFAAGFAARDVLAGRAVRTTSTEVPDGIARGVTAQGALRVEAPDGSVAMVASGEVSVRLADGGG